MVAELAAVIGQEHLTKPGSVLERAASDGQSIVLYSPDSSGKSMLLSQLAPRASGSVSAQLTPSEFKVELARARALFGGTAGAAAPSVVVEQLGDIDKAKAAILERFIDDGGRVYAEMRDVGRLTDSLRDRVTIVKLKRLTIEDLRRIIAVNAGFDWTDEALEFAAQAVAYSGRSAAKLGRLVRPEPIEAAVSVEDVKAALEHLSIEGEGDVGSEIVSTWIKEMRLGNEEAALYWVHAALDNRISIPYLARRLAIFTVEDGWSAEALTVGAAIQAMAAHQPREWNAVIWGTAYMCRIPKFWESAEGRRYEERRRAAVIASHAGETKGARMRQFPSYGLDRHTRFGRSQMYRGLEVDERFSGHFSGRKHMCDYFAAHGELDPQVRDKEIEAATVKNRELRKSLGEM